MNTFNESQISIGDNQINSKGEVVGKSIIDIFQPAQDMNVSKEFEDSLDKPEKIKDSYSYFLSVLKTGFKNNPGKDKRVISEIGKFLTYIEGDPYFKNTPEGFSVYGKDWISSARLHEYLYYVGVLLKENNEVFKNYPVNYALLSILAGKEIKNKQEALVFLTSENWLKK